MLNKIETYGVSDIGLQRSRNEDVWGEVAELGFHVLADGMGGHQGGDIAAQTTVDVLLDYAREHLPLPENIEEFEQVKPLLVEAIELANEQVVALSRTEARLRGMGSTVCCCHFSKIGLVYAHVGDSRIYHLRGGKLEQLTQDHSLLTQLLAKGQISEQEAEHFIYKHVITRAIGTRQVVVPDIAHLSVEEGDLLMMCSDGLSDLVDAKEMEAVLNSYDSLQERVEKLIEAVYAKGARDNTTIVLMACQST